MNILPTHENLIYFSKNKKYLDDYKDIKYQKKFPDVMNNCRCDKCIEFETILRGQNKNGCICPVCIYKYKDNIHNLQDIIVENIDNTTFNKRYKYIQELSSTLSSLNSDFVNAYTISLIAYLKELLPYNIIIIYKDSQNKSKKLEYFAGRWNYIYDKKGVSKEYIREKYDELISLSSTKKSIDKNKTYLFKMDMNYENMLNMINMASVEYVNNTRTSINKCWLKEGPFIMKKL